MKVERKHTSELYRQVSINGFRRVARTKKALDIVEKTLKIEKEINETYPGVIKLRDSSSIINSKVIDKRLRNAYLDSFLETRKVLDEEDRLFNDERKEIIKTYFSSKPVEEKAGLMQKLIDFYLSNAENIEILDEDIDARDLNVLFRGDDLEETLECLTDFWFNKFIKKTLIFTLKELKIKESVFL